MTTETSEDSHFPSDATSAARPAPTEASRWFLAAAGATGAIAPWLLGGDPVAAQWVLLAGAVLTLATGWWVRVSCVRTKSGRAAWKAEQLCLWCGAALLALMLVQALNSAFRVEVTGETSQLVQLQPVPWAPQSILDAFDGGGGSLPVFRNAWRFLLIFGLGWLYAFGLAAGFRERENARRWAQIMGVNAALLALVSIAHVAGGAEFTLWFFPGDGGAPGAPVFFHKNHNGAYLAALVALACGLAGSAKERSIRRGWECVALLLWVATVVVDSRVATVCATLWVLIYAVGRRRAAIRAGQEPSDRRTWLVTGAVVAVVAGLLAVAGANRAVARFSGDKETAWDLVRGGNTRVMIREVGLAMWMDRPLTGWGGGSYANLFGIYQHKVTAMQVYLRALPADAPRPSGATAKCDWVEFLVEYGVIGLVLMLGIVGVHVRWWLYWRGWKNALPTFVLLGGLGLLLHACFDSILRNPALLLLFSGMQIAAVRLAAPAKGKRPSSRSRRTGDPSSRPTPAAAAEGEADAERDEDEGE